MDEFLVIPATAWADRLRAAGFVSAGELLRERVRELEAAIREYAHHRPWCAARPRGGASWTPLPEMGACDCGLSEMVRG